jgi:uncharacterized protein (TIGR03435 family)
MTFADLSPLANHLWQSTLFAAAAWALTLALRKNRASVRYWIWLAASVKFLVPFSLLVVVGAQLGWRTAPATVPSQLSFAMDEISQPFTIPAQAPLSEVSLPAQNPLPAILFGVWLCGIAIGVIFWLRPWRQIRAVLRAATPLDLNLPIPVMSSSARLEPGVVGIVKPVLLLPEGITEHLTPAQLDAVLAHELCHVQRRDNLTAAIHMLVETLFWFHPLAWWIRTRLMEERERACDECVLRLGGEPQIYAESILKVCEFYLGSPVTCATGVTGGELKERIEGIVTNRFTRKLSYGKKILLAAAALAAIGVPVGIGVMTPQPSHAQSQVAAPAVAAPAFEVASVKPSSPQAVGVRRRRDPGLLDYGNESLISILADAYNVDWQLISGPSWLPAARYDIVAKIPQGAPASQVPAMLQRLLSERLKVKVHHETKVTDCYVLAVGRGSPKLERAKDAPAADPSDRNVTITFGKASSSASGPADGFHRLENVRPPETGFQAVGVTMTKFSVLLKSYVQLPVVDSTGLQGAYNFTFQFDDGPEGREPPYYYPPALFTAIEHLGLKLEARRVPVDHLVVDHVEKIPIEN